MGTEGAEGRGGDGALGLEEGGTGVFLGGAGEGVCCGMGVDSGCLGVAFGVASGLIIFFGEGSGFGGAGVGFVNCFFGEVSGGLGVGFGLGRDTGF